MKITEAIELINPDDKTRTREILKVFWSDAYDAGYEKGLEVAASPIREIQMP